MTEELVPTHGQKQPDCANPGPGSTAAHLPALQDAVARAVAYGRSARSPATDKGYDSDWRDFQAWCRSAGLDALPAEPTTIGLYLAAAAERLKYATLRRRLAAICVMHRMTGHHLDRKHPAISQVMQGIARTKGTRPVKKQALVAVDLKTVVKKIPADLTGARDYAMLLIGFAAALRRSEVAAIDLEHLTFSRRGVVLLIPSSKTDQVGAGELLAIPRGKRYCPVTALEAWLGRSGITTGPVFRSIAVGDRIGDRITGGSICRILKARVAAAGFDPAPFGAHSLRSGFITTAAEGGGDLVFIMRLSRHKDVKTAQGYVQAAQLFDNPALKAVRL